MKQILRMIADFEVIETKYEEEEIFQKCKFTIGNTPFYSRYKISHKFSKIYLAFVYFVDVEFNTQPIPFSNELENEIKMLILKQKDIRLRHLYKPYAIY